MLKNINFKKLQGKLKISKKSFITNTVIAVAGVAIGATLFTGCSKNDDKVNNKPVIETTQENTDLNTETPSIEVETPNVEAEVQIEEIEEVEEVQLTELTIEEFDKLVSSVEEANIEAGLNLRKENLELVTYINNINIATPELIEKIESSYNYNEEDMLNVYLQTITAYNNDRNDFYNGIDTKYADMSLMFTDKIDRETIKHIDTLFEELHTNMAKKSNIELTMTKFNKMVLDIMAKNEELGIELSKEEIEIAIYQRNIEFVTEEVKNYVSKIKLEEGQTLEAIDNNTLNIYKAFNEESDKDFTLSSLEYESYYIGSVVSELESYTRENGKINGYAKDQLTVGGLFAAKLQIDDAFAYFATTGYANGYEDNISGIQEANFEAIISRTYAVLGSKASLVECEENTTGEMTGSQR